MKKEIKKCCDVMAVNSQRMDIYYVFKDLTDSYSFYIEDIGMSHCPWCGAKLELEPEEEMETWYYLRYFSKYCNGIVFNDNARCINEVISKIDFSKEAFRSEDDLIFKKFISVPKGTPIEEIYKKLEEVKI